MSGIHAVIEESGGQWWLIDLGSLHGTKVNGESTNKVALNDGDAIQFGTTSVTFFLGAYTSETR